ncbi:MAG: choice-of-anchor D domain-containing protein [Kiritimatiellae bacterium]|nr:choice-of-anchor D domain-containing protein [Kiritimatiellia bacterium]
MAATEGNEINGLSNKVEVTWSDIEGETGYAIWRSLSYDTNTADCIGTVAAGVEAYDDETAVPGWPYYYWIEATNSTSGSTSDWSDFGFGFRTPLDNVGEGTVLALDGREMVRATIVPNSDDHPILVLHSTEAAVLTNPSPSTDYSQGGTIDTATIVYKGPAAGFKEHVVPPNSTNHYRIYSIQENGVPSPPYYSDGLIPGSPLITMPYPENVYSETFSYTNLTLSTGSFSNKAGGSLNWPAGWSLTDAGSGHGWTVQTNGVDTYPVFALTKSNYPTVVGNRAVLQSSGSTGHNAARRTITTTNSGTIYVGAVVSFQYNGTGKYMTIGLMNGDTTEVEFGKVYGSANTFDIRRGTSNGGSTYVMNGWGETGGTDNWYWMVIKYDFDNDTAYAKCFYQGDGIPYLEPGAGDWDVTWSTMDIPQLTAIELKGGSDDGWIGGAVWDEIRVSSIWPELIGQPGLIPWPAIIDFGEVESTLSSNLTVYIANSGGDNVPLYVTNEPSITITGDDAGYFTISTNRFEDLLFYTQSNHFSITFWPTNSGTEEYSATLLIENNSGVNPYPIQIVGTGIPTVSTNVPMVTNYTVGHTRWANDAMVTSGVFAVTATAYHVRGLYVAGEHQPTYNLINGEGVCILTNEPFDSYQTSDGQTFILSDAVHEGYWPATPSTNYQLQVTLMASNLIGHTNTLYTADGVTRAGELFITEYVEGSGGYDKALEIFNGTGADVDLSQYGFRLIMNNASWDMLGSYEQLPAVTLGAGTTFVLAHPDASQDILDVADWTSSTICIFNGDDTVLLYKGPGEELPVDALFAVPSGGNFYQDKTIRRLSSVTNASQTYNDLEWETLANDTIDGLGFHEMDGALGKLMHFTVDDDDVEPPLITTPLMGGIEPGLGSPGPDLALTNIPETGLEITWDIQDYDSGIYAASNRFVLRTGANVISETLAAGALEDGDGTDEALSLSATVPVASLSGGDYVLALVGSDYDPEYVGDILTVSNQYFFRILAATINVQPTLLDFGQVGVGLTSNMLVTVSNSGNEALYIEDIEFVGTGYALFESDIDQVLIDPGETQDITVYFTPAGGGWFDWQMVIHNDSVNDPEASVQLLGNCYDPETTPPEIVEYVFDDAVEATGDHEVTDHAAAQGEIDVSFTLYQYTGMRTDGASFDLLYPDGTFAFENVPLSATVTVTNEGSLCTVFVANPPPFYPAVLGVYTARVSAISSNGIQIVDEVNIRTLGGGVQEKLETFDDVTTSGTISSYLDGTTTGADLGVWAYKGTRWDQTISAKAPTVGPLGHLESPELSGGLSGISFDYKRPFSETGAFDYDVLVNGDVVGTVTAMPPQNVVYTFNVSGLEIEGDVQVVITNHGTSNKRMTIDNIKILTLGTSTNEIMEVTVVDEDVTGPEHSGFNVDGMYFATNDFLPGGLVVTGLVTDLQSGVFAGSNRWELVYEGSVIDSGTFTMVPDEDGAAASNEVAGLTATIPGDQLNIVDAQFSLWVFSTDYDGDRPGDWKITSNEYTFGISTYVPVPSQFEAAADGPEMIEMSWELGDATEVVLLWSTTGPITANHIEKGTELAVHDEVGNAVVAYIGALDELEIVVPPNSDNYLRLFGKAGTTYSAGFVSPSENPVATPSYERGEIVDQFAYTNSLYSAEGTNFVFVGGQKATGQGWDGPWTGDTDRWFIEDGSMPIGDTVYPIPYANKIKWIDTSSYTADSAAIVRKLTIPRNNRIFVAFLMNYQFSGPQKYMGVSFMSSDVTDCDTEELFFGKVYGQENLAGITDAGTGLNTVSAPNFVLNPGHGQDYVVVGELDFQQKTARMYAFYTNTVIPEIYSNATPVAVYSNAAMELGTITGIRLSAGSDGTDGSYSNELGHLVFDEVRVGATWDEVLNFTYPKVYDYSLENNTNWISDGELSEIGKEYPIQFKVYHRTKVAEAEFNLLKLANPDAYVYDPTNQPVFSNSTLSSGWQIFSNTVDRRAATSEVALATYTSRVWVTSVSDKTTETISLSEQGGADDLFFGEFGEGNNHDKYVEIYNGTGNAIDLSLYFMASQTQTTNKYIIWDHIFPLAHETTWLEHGTTIAIVNGGKNGVVGIATGVRQELVDALVAQGRDYIVSSNDVLTVSGDDPVGLFKWSNTNEWIDVCGIGPEAPYEDTYIMQRMEDAEVPWYYPEPVNTDQWDFRDWESAQDATNNFENFISTAGAYDRIVGLGGFIVFNVYDDDEDPPLAGSSTAIKVGEEGDYTDLTPEVGEREVVFTAWSFTNNASVEACVQPWWGSLLTNAVISWTPSYAAELVDPGDSGTGVNDVFDGYGQINRGVIEMSAIGSWGFSETNVPWIQFELPLVAAEDITMSWAEQGGSYSFTNVQVQWSLTGVDGTFATNAAWPPWTMTDATAWRERFIELSPVIPAGSSKVYLRFLLGPGYGGSSGVIRMDNIQLFGRPEEINVTDGQIAASGYEFHVQGNVYDPDSGIQADQAVMKMGAVQGTVDGAKANLVDGGKGEETSLWWDVGPFSKAELTDLVLESESGAGLPLGIEVPDADTDRADDALWLYGSLGRMRVVDDDTERPKLTLQTMKPRTGILAQWRFTTIETLFPTRSDASVEFSRLMCETENGAVSTPRFWSVSPEGGIYSVRQSGWHYNTKYWHAEMMPDADMAITNISFYNNVNKTNGPTHFYIRKYVGGSHVQSWGPYFITGSTNTPINTNTWYSWSQNWPTNAPITVPAGQVTQIRIHGLGGQTNSIGTYWAIADLTFLQGSVGTNGVTEVTDEEFTSGSFKLLGSTWDDDSGIQSPTAVDEAKRPRYSMNAPNGSVIVTNEPLVFAGEITCGDVRLEAEGAFEADLPQPSYPNVMLGEYRGSASVWDFDDDRTVDDLQMTADLSMYVVDNDVTPPGSVGNVFVNGVAVPAEAPDRMTAAWTNQPEFLVTFDDVAHDQEADEETTSEKQRAVVGIGEYRVTTNNVVGLNPTNRAAMGKPYAVATTNGALANYGFEMGATTAEAWTFAGDATIQWMHLAPGLVKEGTNSLKLANGASAYQLIEFRNTEATAPVVGVSGWYRSDTTEGSTVRIEAFAATNLATPVDIEEINLPATGTNWTSFAPDPAVALGDGTVEVLKISLIDGGGNTTYWDDIRLSVDIGANVPSMRFVAGVENQGLSNPQYVFAVDADNNRAADRLAGEAKPFYIAYDITPPTRVGHSSALTASTDTVDDPTTQFDLQWSTVNVGPDNPVDDNHPTKLSTDRDILSPWGSYKVYYGTFDPLNVPSGDGGAGNGNSYIYTNFIATGDYLTWSNVTAMSDISDPSATGKTNYLAMTNMGQTRIRLYDLDFDQDYAVIIVGVDKAGNEGPADVWSWATNNTIKFALTRGWTMPKTDALAVYPTSGSLANTNTEVAAGLAWLAAGVSNTQPDAYTRITNAYLNVSKEYDLIRWDAPSFQETNTADWQLVGTVRSNWFVDDGAFGRTRSQPVRFYRASYKDRWRKTRTELVQGEPVEVPQRPIASEEVYAMHSVVVSPGQNFVALHGLPYTNTFEAVFGGTETFPGSDSALSATKVEFFTPGTNSGSTAQYYLNANGRWIELSVSGQDVQDVTTNVQEQGFFNRGFSITLPDPLPEGYATTTALDYNQLDESNQAATVEAMIWSPIAQVPTNGFSQVIQCGSNDGRVETLVYNVVALRLPVATHPSRMRLLESGFVNGYRGLSDEIYTMNTATKSPLSNTKIYCDEEGVWRLTRTDKPVPGDFFKPNDVIVIISRNWVGTGSWTWTYHPNHFYTLPDRWMGH